MFLENGERGLLIGQTGSGKTQNAIFQLRHAKQWPVIIFDTKIEDEFFGIPEGDQSMDLVEGIDQFEAYSKKARKDYADFILVRPLTNELQDFETLDKYSGIVYEKFGKCFIYYDEIFNWHNRGSIGNNLLGLLTRGRSKGKTVLMASQRPSWISRFVISESKKFYLHFLSDVRDIKRIAEVVPYYDHYEEPPEFHFYFHHIGKMKEPLLHLPVPKQDLEIKKIFREKWL